LLDGEDQEGNPDTSTDLQLGLIPEQGTDAQVVLVVLFKVDAVKNLSLHELDIFMFDWQIVQTLKDTVTLFDSMTSIVPTWSVRENKHSGE